MKVLLSAVGLLGLAMAFSLFEPAPASSQPVKSDDVQLVTEQMSSDDQPEGLGKNARKNHRKNQRKSGARGRGGRRLRR